MKITLNRAQIDDAIALGQKSLARFINVPGRYTNSFNSHTLGRFGEIAIASFFESSGFEVLSHFRDLASLKLCDVEVVGSVPYRRLEVKTWGAANWVDLGRCVQVGQLSKIQAAADAIIWCTVPLPYLRSTADLANLTELVVTCAGISPPSDVAKAPIKQTGRAGARKVKNYQLPQDFLRAPEGLFAPL